MTQHAGRHPRITGVTTSVVLGVLAVLAVVGAVILFIGTRVSDGPPQPSAGVGRPPPVSAPVTTAPATDTQQNATGRATEGESDTTDLGPSLSASPPVAITIPSIGVHTRTFVDLGLDAGGSLEAPRDFSAVGWYTQGPSPGQLGPAILAGHVDSHNGPAIFYRLGALRPGAQVSVARKDGSTARFTVDRIQRFAKDRFPIAQVYGNVHRAELRLITCGGSFDAKSGHYVDNIVAFAHLSR